MSIKWSLEAESIFNKVISNLPQFHRNIAKKLVKEKAEELAKKRGVDCVENKDLITAFFQEVPAAFKDMMKRLFSHLKIEYGQFLDNGKSKTNRNA